MKWVVDEHIKNFPAWSGAVDTLDNVKRAGDEYLDKLESLIQTEFEMDTPTDTQINDLLWFEPEYIYSSIGLTEDGEIPDENEDGEDE